MNVMENKMLIVAVTGRSGCGKSTVTRHFAAMGHPVADGDEISRDVTKKDSPCLAALVAAFGQGILTDDGQLKRRTLGEIAFKTPENNKKLIEITHPAIIAEFLRRASVARKAGARLFFVDGAVIVGGPFQRYCDKIILVNSWQTLCIKRIVQRDGITIEAAMQRLAAQQPLSVLRSAADYIIRNNEDQQQLLQSANQVLAQLLQADTEMHSDVFELEV